MTMRMGMMENMEIIVIDDCDTDSEWYKKFKQLSLIQFEPYSFQILLISKPDLSMSTL